MLRKLSDFFSIEVGSPEGGYLGGIECESKEELDEHISRTLIASQIRLDQLLQERRAQLDQTDPSRPPEQTTDQN